MRKASFEKVCCIFHFFYGADMEPLHDDQTPFGTSIKRYARSSMAAGEVLLRLLGNRYLNRSFDHTAYAESLREVLSHLKGPAMKIGQIMATVPGMVPEAYFQEFLTLQSSAPPMGWGFVRRRMKTELGDGWEGHFDSFEKKASAAASLGQVHQGVYQAKKVACKLQYPHMKGAVEADFKQLKVLLKIYETWVGALHTQHIQEEITQRLYEELDYEREAFHIELFCLMLKSVPGIRVPRVKKAVSTKRLLTMDWLPGEPFLEAQRASHEQRCHIAQALFYGWYYPFYHYGVLHGDPHLGNYTVNLEGPKPCLNLLDFGCVRLFPPVFVEAVLHLYRGLKNNNRQQMIQAYELWGFQALSPGLVDALNMWAHFIYRPLLDDSVRPIDNSFSGSEGRKIAWNVHQKLKEIGGVAPPREFVFMDRAAVGVGSALIHLRVEMNWHRLFEDLIEGFSLQMLSQNQERLLQECSFGGASF